MSAKVRFRHKGEWEMEVISHKIPAGNELFIFQDRNWIVVSVIRTLEQNKDDPSSVEEVWLAAVEPFTGWEYF